jgi:hypothetical protein
VRGTQALVVVAREDGAEGLALAVEVRVVSGAGDVDVLVVALDLAEGLVLCTDT